MPAAGEARSGVFCALLVAVLSSAGPDAPPVTTARKIGVRRELSTVDLNRDLAVPADLSRSPPVKSQPVFRANSFVSADPRSGGPKRGNSMSLAPPRRETSQADLRQLSSLAVQPGAPILRDADTAAAEQDLRMEVKRSHGLVVGEATSEEVRSWEERVMYTGEVLGVGGFSVVHAAKDEVKGTKYAVKVVKLPSKNACFVRRLIREVRILQELDHPNIVQLHKVIASPDTCHLFMEHCTGGELLGMMEKMEFSDDGVRSLAFEDVNGGEPVEFGEEQVVHVLHQVLLAVKHCHDRHIVHRDIKMENVLLCQPWQTGDRRVKLADFGFATVLGQNERLTSACGSPHYCSPELLAGSKEGAPGYRLEADMWALGVIAYSLLCCQYPFDGVTDADVVRAVSKGGFAFPDHVVVSPQAQDFIRSLLHVDVAARCTIDGALEHPWITANLAGKAHADASRRAQESHHHGSGAAAPGAQRREGLAAGLPQVAQERNAAGEGNQTPATAQERRQSFAAGLPA